MCHNPIEVIVRRFGGQSELARNLGCSQATVWHWSKVRRLSSHHIERIIEVGREMDPPVDLEPNDFFPARFRRIPSQYRKLVRTP